MKYSNWLKGRTASMASEEKSGYCLGSADAWQEQQKRIDELTKEKSLQEMEINQLAQANQQWRITNDKLRAEVKKLIEEYKSEEKELELKEWEQSTIYGRIAIELEEVLKGDKND